MKAGFSLVEVVVAMILLSIGGGAAMSLLSTANRRLERAWTLQLALVRATELSDSLAVGGPEGTAGESIEPWGRLRWSGGPRGTVMAWISPDSIGLPVLEVEVASWRP